MRIVGFIFQLVFLWMTVSCSGPDSALSDRKETGVEQDSSFLMVPSHPVSITVASVGDVMMHRWQMEKAYRSESATFDYSNVFSHMKPYFEKSDYSIGNLETTFAGKNKGKSASVCGYSCFPYFNAPDTFAYTLKALGLDLMTVANNHIFDSGYSGLCSTLDLLDSVGIAHVGAVRTRQDFACPFLVDVKGVKLGICAYTSSINGIYVPDSLKFVVNSIEGYDSTKMSMMKKDVSALKSAGADAVIALVHFGTEYQENPNRYQKLVADSLLAYGVDVLFGSHPHIIQSMEVRKVDRNGVLHNCVVFYSLGNFLSSQVWNGRHSKDIGLFASVKFTKWNGYTRVASVSCVPTYSYWQPQYIGVLPVLEALSSSEQYAELRLKDWTRLNFASQEIKKILFPENIRYKERGFAYVIELKE